VGHSPNEICVHDTSSSKAQLHMINLKPKMSSIIEINKEKKTLTFQGGTTLK
jgi:hypothetical protein